MNISFKSKKKPWIVAGDETGLQEKEQTNINFCKHIGSNTQPYQHQHVQCIAKEVHTTKHHTVMLELSPCLGNLVFWSLNFGLTGDTRVCWDQVLGPCFGRNISRVVRSEYLVSVNFNDLPELLTLCTCLAVLQNMLNRLAISFLSREMPWYLRQ